MLELNFCDPGSFKSCTQYILLGGDIVFFSYTSDFIKEAIKKLILLFFYAYFFLFTYYGAESIK